MLKSLVHTLNTWCVVHQLFLSTGICDRSFVQWLVQIVDSTVQSTGVKMGKKGLVG